MTTRKFQHTPETAAKAVRVLCEDIIAKTWEQYHGSGKQLNSYEAAKLVQEQCGCDFRTAALALEPVIPELFAEYWEALPMAVAA